MKSETDKQRVSRIRNHKIYRLRGLQAQASMLSSSRSARVSVIIDEELAELGAETKSSRMAKLSIGNTPL